MSEAPGVVSVVMRDAVGQGVHHEAREAGLEGHLYLKV